LNVIIQDGSVAFEGPQHLTERSKFIGGYDAAPVVFLNVVSEKYARLSKRPTHCRL